ncbi:T9SS type A sorting domain-containing protein [Crocinitomicaceae bacterium]|nr:T9SS type A sorting domain-containing protein [Crocinitomicaceae bacterium]
MGNLIRLLIFLLMTNFGHSQIKFFNFYTDTGVDKGEGVVQLEDSSYVVTGSSSSFVDGSSQAFLMKVDSLGNHIWSKHYGGVEFESGRRVLHKKGVGFYICGFTNSIGAGGFDFYLVKTDESGLFEWENSYGGNGWEKVHDALITVDTNIIMVGETSSNATDNKDIYIIQTNQFGDTLWTRTFGGIGDDYATSILEIDDTTFIVGGRYFNEDSLLTKSWVSKMHVDGTVYWENQYGVNQNSWLNAMYFDGSIVRGVGGTSGDAISGVNTLNMVIELNGTYISEVMFSNVGDNEYVGIVKSAPFGDYYVPYTADEPGGFLFGNDVIIQQRFSDFIWISNFVIAHEYDETMNQIIETNDGEAILVGYTTSFISGGNEIYLCKIGPGNDYPDVNNDFVVNSVVGVIKEELDDKIKIYPNPSNGIFNVSVKDIDLNLIQVYNTIGQTVYYSSFSSQGNIDIVGLSSGYYILEISGNSKMIRRKIIIRN